MTSGYSKNFDRSEASTLCVPPKAGGECRSARAFGWISLSHAGRTRLCMPVSLRTRTRFRQWPVAKVERQRANFQIISTRTLEQTGCVASSSSLRFPFL